MGPNGFAYLRNLSEGVEHLDIAFAGYKSRHSSPMVAKTKSAEKTVVVEKTKSAAVAEKTISVEETVVAQKTKSAVVAEETKSTVVAEKTKSDAVAEKMKSDVVAEKQTLAASTSTLALAPAVSASCGARAISLAEWRANNAFRRNYHDLRSQLLVLDRSKGWELAREVGYAISEFCNMRVYTKKTRLVARMRVRKTHKNAYKRIEIWIPTAVAKLMADQFKNKKYMYLNNRALKADDELLAYVQDKLDDDYNIMPGGLLAAHLQEGFEDMKKGVNTHPIAKEITDSWFAYQSFDVDDQ